MGTVIQMSSKNDAMVTAPSPYGWTCGSCGQWVGINTFHACPSAYQLTPSQPYVYPSTSPQSFGPCVGFTEHVFVAASKHAICNRCEKIVRFDSWFDKTIIWAQSKLGLPNV